MFAPTVEKVASENGLRLVSVNIDEDPQTTAEYNVQGVPTLVLLEDDVEVGRSVGMNTKSRTTAALGLS